MKPYDLFRLPVALTYTLSTQQQVMILDWLCTVLGAVLQFGTDSMDDVGRNYTLVRDRAPDI